MHTKALAPTALQDTVAALCPDGPPRVWSLIVTIFGDTGGEIEIGAGPLARILEPAGVNGAAMRVALHRLKSDGWIISRRIGRSSAYRLHPDRIEETRAASMRIYAAAPPDPAAWYFRALGPDTSTDHNSAGGIQIAQRLMLIPGHPVPRDDALVLRTEEPLPDWVREKLATEELAQAYAQLLQSLSQAEGLTRHLSLEGADAITIRVLVVHAWRRVLLRQPDLPDALFGDDWPGAACRALVQTMLARLRRPDARDLAAI